MRRSFGISLALLTLAAAACRPDASDRAGPSASATPSATASAQVSPSPSPMPASSLRPLPAPDQPIPTDPEELAAELTATSGEIANAVDRWVEEADPSRGQPPDDLVLLALYQQRMYRWMARHGRVADQTIARLAPDLAAAARDIVGAAGKLFSLVRAVPSASTFRIQAPQPAGVLLRYYREAQRRFHVSWQVLAAVNYIESKFGRVKSASYAGAQGPMQFIPTTWQVYGMGGDIHDPHDAILGAANYLHASGAPGNYRSALYHYNRSWEYVDAVLLYANRMTQDSRAYYDIYNWQVFVVTKAGDVRLTGPGL